MTGVLDRAWVAAKGAAKFAAAVEAGDIASAATVAARRSVCRACPSRVRVTVMGAVAASDWCGQPFVETAGERPTCGCLLAGKTSVGSERCPQGRWS